MFSLNLFPNLKLNIKSCFGKNVPRVTKLSDDGLDRNIYNVTREYKISILPIIPDFEIDNLYPLTDHVELWNIFIVGNDKTYILANVNDPHIVVPNAESLPNHSGINILPNELSVVFDSVWTQTLSGKQLQFYMVWNGKLYFINTYPFFNGKKKVIGAILFMRAFESMPPDIRFTTMNGYIVPVKRSIDEGPRSTDGQRVSDNGQRFSDNGRHSPGVLLGTLKKMAESGS